MKSSPFWRTSKVRNLPSCHSLSVDSVSIQSEPEFWVSALSEMWVSSKKKKGPDIPEIISTLWKGAQDLIYNLVIYCCQNCFVVCEKVKGQKGLMTVSSPNQCSMCRWFVRKAVWVRCNTHTSRTQWNRTDCSRLLKTKQTVEYSLSTLIYYLIIIIHKPLAAYTLILLCDIKLLDAYS